MKSVPSGLKFYNHVMQEKVLKIIEKIKINKYMAEEDEILFNLIQKILLNEQTKLNKKKLLDVIEGVNCYKEPEINDFLNCIIQNIIRIHPDNIYTVIKERVSSSNHSIVSNLEKFGFLYSENEIKYLENGDNKEVELKEIDKESIILVIDDYVGSGSAIIDILKALEEKYENQDVRIISYIWQESAIKRVEDYITEIERNNKYDIYKENIIIEKSYSKKYEDNSNILKYIEKTCSTCKNNEMKFGYKNSGAMLTINGLSPNNNISMLWRTDLKGDESWIPPFSRNINSLLMESKKEKIIKESYSRMRSYYENFYYKEEFDFEEFKMLLLLFNSYCMKIKQITELFGLDTLEETEKIIEKFKEHGIIRYEIDNIIEFIDNKVIRQFKIINQNLSRTALDEFKKKNTNKLRL